MKIKINKLFGKYNTEIEIDKELNILVGENGVGKSNILRICNNVLNNDYVELTKYYFEDIEVHDEKLKEPIIISHNLLFPEKEELCEIIEEKDKNTEEGNKLLDLIEKLDENNLLNEFMVYCYFNSSLSGKLERCLDRYSSNVDKQIIYINKILENMREKNSDEENNINAFVNIEEIVKKNKKCYYLDFVENYRIENQLCKEGIIENHFIDNKTRFYDGYYKIFEGDKYLYSVFDKKTGKYVPVYDDDDYNIYNLDEYGDEIDRNIKEIEVYKFNNFQIKPLNIDKFLNKLINSESKEIDINKLITNYYYDEKFIEYIYSKITKLEEKYKDYFISNKYEQAQLSDSYIPSRDEIEKIRKFYENEDNIDMIKNYILPLMPKNSPYMFFISRAYSQIIDERNYMFFSLYEIYNCIIDDVKKYTNERIKKLEELLNKYIMSKEIKIKPTGIHIFDKEMDKNEGILKTNYQKDVELNFLSAGEKKIVILLVLGVFVENSIFIIDEIENSLSIIWQEKIISDLVKFNRNNNLLIATQSAYALKDKDIQKDILFLPLEEV